MTNLQFPLLPIQSRLWFLSQLGASNQDEAIYVAYKIPDGMRQEVIQERLDKIVEENTALRTVIYNDSAGPGPVQKINPLSNAHGLFISDLDGDGGSSCFDSITMYIAHIRHLIADLSSTSFFRADLLRFANSSHVLLLTAHRLICDVDSLVKIANYILGQDRYGLTQSCVKFETYLKNKGNDYKSDIGNWAQSLEDATLVCELPLDNVRPLQQQGQTSSYQMRFSEDVFAGINRIVEICHASYSVILLAAYYAMIYRYTLQDDILMGIAQRPSSPDVPTVGPFTDIIVIRQQFAEDISFSRLVTSLKERIVDIAVSPPPPFSLLLNALSPARDFSRAPVVQHGFSFKNSNSSSALQNAKLERICAGADLQQLDLFLRVCLEDDIFVGEWIYDTALFSDTTVKRFHEHVSMLIKSAAQDSERPVRQLLLATPQEEAEITVIWNRTSHPVPDNDFVYRLFEKQAERTPFAIAARDPNGEITYSDLNHRANQMAHSLVEKGIGAGDIVPILADRDIDYLVAMIAINKSGGAFLPLSPVYPARRLAAIFEKCNSQLVLVGDNYLNYVKESVEYITSDFKILIAAISTIVAADTDGFKNNLPDRCGMNDLAYVMFTSGSTGEPKGVMVHHAGNINHIYAKLGDLGMNAVDILAQTSRQSFDIMVWQFLAPLVIGGSIYIVPDEIALDPSQLLSAANQYGITVLQLVPVNIEALLDVADAMGNQRPPLKALRWMVPTGDALPTDLCRRWLTLYPHIRMLNTYGATECSDDQCHHVIDSPPPPYYRPAIMTIGKPIINTQVYILDDAMQTVPIGVVGELYIAGVGVGRGYLKDPDRTARTFVKNPFSSDPDSKLYRSGDQARYLPDGTIEFIGRIGHMIKIRGMRIEPGEIQSVLGRHAQVAQATLLVHDFPGIGTHLIAYVVYRKGKTVDDNDLRIYLRQYLPDYMIPSYFVALESMPLNANGKLDRKALPIPDISATKSLLVVPRNSTERTLFDIWSRVLGRNELSVFDNFFDVGGHSLLAMQLFSKIEQTFGQRLPLKTIFHASTIASQAELLIAPANKNINDDFSNLSCVVPINVGNRERTSFFYFHAAGGHVVYIRHFADLLGVDQPFYGIQAVGIEGDRPPLYRLEDFVRIYLQEIRTLQPEGPYYLGGESMGATIAFEAARQLEDLGHKVGLLAMFDSSWCGGVITLKPGVPLFLYEFVYNWKRLLRLHLPELFALSWKQKREYLIYMIKRVIVTLQRVLFGYEKVKTTSSDPILSVVQEALLHARSVYRPGLIHTPITLFSSELPWGAGDETLGWRRHTSGGVRIQRFPILFDTMLEGKSARLVADSLRHILDEQFVTQTRWE